MKFEWAGCELCRRQFFDERDLIAYQRTNYEIRPIGLDGQAPVHGVGCVCKSCLSALWTTRQQIPLPRQAGIAAHEKARQIGLEYNRALDEAERIRWEALAAL